MYVYVGSVCVYMCICNTSSDCKPVIADVLYLSVVPPFMILIICMCVRMRMYAYSARVYVCMCTLCMSIYMYMCIYVGVCASVCIHMYEYMLVYPAHGVCPSWRAGLGVAFSSSPTKYSPPPRYT